MCSGGQAGPQKKAELTVACATVKHMPVLEKPQCLVEKLNLSVC